MDVKVLKHIDDIVRANDRGWNVKDGEALEYINDLQIPLSQVYDRLGYKNYYFTAKKEYKIKMMKRYNHEY